MVAGIDGRVHFIVGAIFSVKRPKMGIGLVDVGWLPRSVQSLILLPNEQRDVASLNLYQLRRMRRW